MDGSVVLLELLSRLVEVLDTLAPAESTGVGTSALAVPCFRELVCDALNEALGLRGFLPLCISYVKGSPLEELETVAFLSFLYHPFPIFFCGVVSVSVFVCDYFFYSNSSN